ncbi:peptide MFS transporter [Lactococcus fujiensis]|uniref:Di-/tripeptide transporter n=1 Tax=Lactococcus fujiensis JCM 16395 TaxID=1291764 RepID=A0A2A5RPE2_9LACT|nr:peptide MFS transporter [Lactococcus fujiensis]PCS01313.1 di-/tripeptide transporter [Lactococcus fujiensis JCM 16395]
MENLNKSEKLFFGQPRALLTLFQTELWERFSYYGMRAILLYYLYTATTSPNAGLGLPVSQAMAIVSIYGALVYLSAIVGGWIADRLIGASKTIFIGGILIMLGHIALAIPFGLTSLFISLALIILGTGMLKPNISNMVGHLYSKEDPRRDTGFNIFYFGVNVGSLLAPIIVGTVGQSYNYHLGFSLAAIGMLVALFVYWRGRTRLFPEIGKAPSNPMDEKEKSRFLIIFIVALVAVVAVMFGLYTYSAKNFIDNLINVLSIVGILVPIAYLVRMFTSKEVTSEERSKLVAYIPMFISAILFWVIEEQSSTVIATWGAERSNLHPVWFGLHITIDPSWYQLLNPLFIVLLTPVVVAIWNKMGERQPSTIVKFGLGLILTGVSYVIMMAPGLIDGVNGRSSSLWLILMFAIQMAGELLVSPVGLSVSTKLAPVAFQSQMIAMWLLSDAGAQAINAQIAPLFTKSTEIAFFGIVGGIGVVVGLILLLIKKPILKLMGDVR